MLFLHTYFHKAKVERVIIDGLGRTKDDLIVKQVKDIFQADNFQEVGVYVWMGPVKNW